MSNFVRAMLLCLRRPVSLAVALLSSVIVACVWSANIGALYPMMDVLFQGRSMSEWVEEDIAAYRAAINAADQRIAQLQAEKSTQSPEAQGALADEIDEFHQQRTADAQAMRNRQRIRPWIAWMPPVLLAMSSSCRSRIMLLGAGSASLPACSNSIHKTTSLSTSSADVLGRFSNPSARRTSALRDGLATEGCTHSHPRG